MILAKTSVLSEFSFDGLHSMLASQSLSYRVQLWLLWCLPEKYKDYFTTPYFIFFRDTLSYLTLLGLHFAICLFPSSVAFSRLEWVILVFFLGRVVMEVDQFISVKEAGMKAQKLWRRNRGGSSYQVRSHEGHQETNEAEEDNILRKKLSNYFRYFGFFLSVF